MPPRPNPNWNEFALAPDDLKRQVADGAVDTVLVCFVDMQGRLMGKRFHAVNFVETSYRETHCCNYLLATDLEMATPEGYASTSWEKGCGDYVMQPDLETIRPVPWLEGTALVLCDILDHHTHEEVPHAPRAILKRQIARLKELGFDAMMATELEFFLFEHSLDHIRKSGFRDLSRSVAITRITTSSKPLRKKVSCALSAITFLLRVSPLRIPRARPRRVRRIKHPIRRRNRLR